MKTSLYWKLIRPFTLLAPLVGFLSGATVAQHSFPPLAAYVGALAAVCLNAASNIINQIFDLEIDRVNKPERLLASGRVSMREAVSLAGGFTLVSFLLAWAVPNKEFFGIVFLTFWIVFFYSAPPLRIKRIPFLANFWIAIPRGSLLVISGWTSVKSFQDPEIWFLAAIFGLFVFGATTTKDFSDMEGDRRFGCRTIPIVLGIQRAGFFMAPFLIFPFLLLPIGATRGFLSGRLDVLKPVGLFLSLWGMYVTWLILRRPEALAVEKNHPSWKHMYLMLIAAQIGTAFAYWR